MDEPSSLNAALAILAAALLVIGPAGLLDDASAQSEERADLHLNVVGAEDLSCSDDEEDTSSHQQADLRVSVYVDDELFLRTKKAQDRNEPVYGSYEHRPDRSVPVDVRIKVEEAEPAGWFGTHWDTCDTTSEQGNQTHVTWSGEDRHIVDRGEAGNATEVEVVLGSDAPSQPELRVTEPGEEEVVVGWNNEGSEDEHRLRWRTIGPFIGDAEGHENRFRITGLCDYSRYGVSLIQITDPWQIRSPELRFDTDNAPPDPPEILRADRTNDTVDLAWSLDTYHDIDRFDVYVGEVENLTLDNGTREATVQPNGVFQPYEHTADGIAESKDYVVVEATDEGGLSTASDPFPIDGPSDSMDESFRPEKEPCQRSYGLAQEDDDVEAEGEAGDQETSDGSEDDDGSPSAEGEYEETEDETEETDGTGDEAGRSEDDGATGEATDSQDDQATDDQQDDGEPDGATNDTDDGEAASAEDADGNQTSNETAETDDGGDDANASQTAQSDEDDTSTDETTSGEENLASASADEEDEAGSEDATSQRQGDRSQSSSTTIPEGVLYVLIGFVLALVAVFGTMVLRSE